MRGEKKFGKKYLICAVIAAIMTVASIVLAAYSSSVAGRSSELGIDPKDNITKLYTGDDGVTVAGLQDGTLYSVSQDGEQLWNVGKPFDVAVYDILVSGERVYAVYANGRIVSFDINDAKNYSESENFIDRCKVYAAINFKADGNVKNTQLQLSDDGKTIYLRGVFNSSSANNKIYSFDVETGERDKVDEKSKAMNGMSVDGGNLYYSVGSEIYVCNENGKEPIADVNERIVSLTAFKDTAYVVTENNNIIAVDKNGGQKKQPLGLSLDTAYVFSAGKNFVAKILNGGVAVVNAEKMNVELNMKAGNDANLIMWNERGFALRDESDAGNPSIVYYEIEFAHTKVTFTALKTAGIILAIIFTAATLYFAFGTAEKYRTAMNAKVRAFGKALVKDKVVYISMIVPFALLILFYYIPIILGFRLSFYDYLPGIKDVFVGFDNFVMVFRSSEFWKSSLTMLAFLVTDLLKAIIPPIIFAEAIAAVRSKRFSLWVRILMFLPGVLPGVATTLVWSTGVFGASHNSLMNAFMRIFVPDFAMNWINDPSTALGTLIAFGFPWIGSYLIFYGAITGINVSYFEAAKLDGCSWVKRIIKIDLPLILPQIKYIFVTSFIASVQNYTSIFVIHGTDGIIKTPALLMYREIISANYGVASVMGITIFLFLSVATFFNFRMQSDNS